MTSRGLLVRGALALLLMAVVAACNTATPSPSPTGCDGVSSELGGCDPALRHDYVGTTCEGVGREWGKALDARAVAVVQGTDVVNGEAKSVRLQQVLVITTGDANIHLRDMGLIGECDLPEFLAAGTPEFSPELQAGVRSVAFDGNPVVTFQEWLAEVQSVAGVIDQDE